MIRVFSIVNLSAVKGIPSSQRSLASHLNRGINGVFETLVRHAQLRKIQRFPTRRRVVSRQLDDQAPGFHRPIAPTNRTASASRRPERRRKNLLRDRSGRSFEAPRRCRVPPLPSASHNRSAGMTRPALHRSQQRSSFTGHASFPKPTIASPQIEQTFTGVIARAPLCAHGQAQQRAGRPGLNNTRPAPRSPPQAKVSAIRS